MKTTPPGQAKNQLRIIGGKWRGRKLDFPDAEGLRPTGDRIRETLFNWLRPTLSGAHCLDLFAGSGALGFEALSQGAASATLIETNRAAIDYLKRNRTLLHAEHLTLTQSDCLTWLKTASVPVAFDIVFIDAPFASNLLAPCIAALEASDKLAAQALIYVESARDQAVTVPSNWQARQAKASGQVRFALYERVSTET